MGQCEFCGAATSLYDDGTPICIGCLNRIDAGGKLLKRAPRPPNAHDLEKELVEDLRVARERYFEAKRLYENAVHQQSESGRIDGTFAVNQAIRQEWVEFKKYAEAIKALADFAGRGKSPR